MPDIPSNSLHDYNGGAVKTTLSSRVIDTDIEFNVADASTWPLASSGKWAIATIDRGEPNEERIAYSGRVGNTLKNVIRGADNTVATTHESGSDIEHGPAAQEFREANALVSVFNPDDAADANDLVAAFTPADATTTKALTAAFTPSNATSLLTLLTSTITVNTWTPSHSVLDGDGRGQSLDTGSGGARYVQIGKLVFVDFHRLITMNTGTGGTGAGGFKLTLPVPADVTSAMLTNFIADCQNSTARATLHDTNSLKVYQNPYRNSGNFYIDNAAYWFRITGWYIAA